MALDGMRTIRRTVEGAEDETVIFSRIDKMTYDMFTERSHRAS